MSLGRVAILIQLMLLLPARIWGAAEVSIEATGEGVTIERIPAETLVEQGTLISLTATPVNPSHEFVLWQSDANETLSTSATCNLVAEYSTRVKATVAERVHLGERDVLAVWSGSGISFVREEVDGTPALVARLINPSGSNSYARLLVPDVGSGVLAVEGRSLAGTGYLANTAFTGEWSTQYIPVSPQSGYISGTSNWAVLSTYMGTRDLAIRSVAYLPGAALTVETEGQGSVSRSLDKPVYSAADKVELAAVPAEGWVFLGWDGDVDSQVNPLRVIVEKQKSVRARFGKPFNWNGATVFGLHNSWVQAGASVLTSALDGTEHNRLAALEFEVEGPGQLSFRQERESRSAMRVFIDGEDDGNINYYSEEHYTRLLPEGRHHLRLEHKWNSYLPGEATTLRFMDLRFSPGWMVSAAPGITFPVGITPGDGYVEAGSIVKFSLELPDHVSLVKWGDDLEGTNLNPLYWVASRNLKLAPILLASWPTPAGPAISTGSAVWSRDAEGAYHPPGGAVEETSVIIPTPGPCRVELRSEVLHAGKPVETIQAKVGSSSTYLFSSSETRQVALSSTKDVVRISQSASSAYPAEVDPNIRVFVQQFFPVTIDPMGGTFEAADLVDGYAPAGASVEFNYTPPEGKRFYGWTGDLEGLGLSGSVYLTGPVKASPVFDATGEILTIGGIDWVVKSPTTLEFDASFNANGAWSLGGFIGREVNGEYTLETTLVGPGVLRVNALGSLLTVTANEQEILTRPLSYSFPREVAINVPAGEQVLVFQLHGGDNYTGAGAGLSASMAYDDTILSLTVDAGFGGTINPFGQMFVAKKETVHLEAAPSPSNRFVRWNGLPEGTPPTVDLVMQDHLVISAVFEAGDLLSGWPASYAGPRPIAREVANLYNDLYSPTGLAATDETTFTIAFVGAGVLSQRVLPSSTERYALEAELDGMPLVMGTGSTIDIERTTAEGLHTYSLTLRWLDPNAASGTLRYATLPVFKPGFEVTTRLAPFSGAATLTRAPEMERYPAGSTVTVTADPATATGVPFLGWWIHDPLAGTSQWIEGQAAVELVVNGTIDAEAVYESAVADPPDALPLALTSPTTDFWQWAAPTVEEPQGTLETQVERSVDAVLKTVVTGPAVVEFRWKQANGKITCLLDGQAFFSSTTATDWVPVVVQVPAGTHELGWDFQGRATTPGTFALTGINLTPGYGLTATGAAGSRIVWSSSDPGYGVDGEISAYTIAANDSPFLGWDSAQGRIPAGQTFAAGNRELLKAVHAEVLDAAITWAELAGNFSASYYISNGVTGPYLRSSMSGSGTLQGHAEARAEGPATLFFTQGISAANAAVVTAHDLRFQIDDSDIAAVELPDGRMAVDIPSGSHRLGLFHTAVIADGQSGSVEAQLSWMKLAPGYRVTTRSNGGGGEVLAGPVSEQGTVAPGTEVRFGVNVLGNGAFLRWIGDLAGEPPGSVTRVINQPIDGGADFSYQVKIGQLQFEASGIRIEWNSGYHVRHSGDQPNYLHTQLSGSGLLVVERHHNGDVPIVSVRIGKAWVPVESRDSILAQYAIPAGAEELSLSFPDESAFDRITFAPGYVLWIDSDRGTVARSRVQPVYAAGSEVVLTPMPTEGCTVVNWSDLGFSDLSPRSVLMDGHRHLKADFLTELQSETRSWYFGGDDPFFIVREGGQMSARASSNGKFHPFSLFLALELTGPLEASFPVHLTEFSNLNGAVLKLAVDGTTVREEDIRWAAPAFWTLQLGEGTHWVTWTFDGQPSSSGRYTFQVGEPAITSDRIVRYRQWRRDFIPQSWWSSPRSRSHGDLDGDGLSNFLEFLLQTHPLLPDSLLAAIPVADDGDRFYEFWHLAIPDSVLEDFLVEASFGTLDAWQDVSGQASNPFTFQANGAHWQGFQLGLDPATTPSLWLRLRYTGEMPAAGE